MGDIGEICGVLVTRGAPEPHRRVVRARCERALCARVVSAAHGDRDLDARLVRGGVRVRLR